MTATVKWKERMIRPRVSTSPTTPVVGARCKGSLAVHPTPLIGLDGKWSFSKTAFTVTHLGTKRALRKDLTREEAFELAAAVMDLDWDFTSVRGMPLATKNATREAAAKYGAKRLVKS